MRVAKIRVNPTHPAYSHARSQLIESRRLFNGLNAVARESSARRYSPDSDSHITQEFGLEAWLESSPYLGNYGSFEGIRKTIEAHQNIVLPQKVAQHVAREVAHSWQSFYRLRKVNPKARPPKFKREYGLLQYTSQAVSLRDWRKGVVRPSGWSHGVMLPPGVKKVQAVRVYYANGDIWLEVIHDTPRKTRQTSGKHLAALDLGLDNLATVIVDKPGYRPLIVDGKHLKSLNQYANKRSAAHRSKLDKEAANIIAKLEREGGEKVHKGKISSRKLDRLWGKRNRQVNHYLHSASSALTQELTNARVGVLVIGWNDGFKHKVKLGKRVTQNFVSIPHRKFVDILKEKCERAGIEVRIVNESYTSKASFLDGDVPVKTQEGEKFSGRRITRGQYRASDGRVIHADVNAAWNILVKSKLPIGERNGIVVMPRKFSFAY